MGLLHGNQRQTVTWTFAPADKATYDASMTCSFNSASLAAANMRQLQIAPESATPLAQSAAEVMQGTSQQIGVRMVGQGTIGALTLEPTAIDFGTVAVGFPAVKEITLLNQSGGNLCYSVTCTAVTAQTAIEAPQATGLASEPKHVRAQLQSQQGKHESPDADSAMHLVIEEPSGSLPARATKTLRLTLNPTCRERYTLQLVCHTATASAQGVHTPSTALSTAALPSNLQSPPVCAAVVAFSTYPTVMITDIVCQGLDKLFVWNQMSCSQINTELAAEMTQVCPNA